jgi:competence protein ComEC
MPLLTQIGIAWLTGIALATTWGIPPWQVVVLLCLPGAAAALLYRDTPPIRTTAVLGLALAAALLWVGLRQPVIDEGHIAFYNDRAETVTVTGLVAHEPDVRDTHTNLWVDTATLQSEDGQQPVDGLLLVHAPRYPEYHYGDRLAVTGLLETPPIFEDFSYKDYLARQGIHTMIRRPEIKLVETGQGCLFLTAMFTFKQKAAGVINQALAEPYAGLLNGILLGIETGIPPELYEDFNRTGTSHIIVISGSNILVIAALFLFISRRTLGQRYAPYIAMTAIVIYTLLVGADASVRRAAFMGGMWMLAMMVGRPGLALNSLFFAGISLTLINPQMIWDAGFQLSFAATLGLIVLFPPMERAAFTLYQQWRPGQAPGLGLALLSDLLIMTLAAQMATAPLVLYNFGRLSLVSLLSNALIGPAQPPVMVLGGLLALGGIVWPPLGQFFGWLVWLPLAWTVWVVEQSASLPLASLDFGRMPLWLLLLICITIGAGAWMLTRSVAVAGQFYQAGMPRIGSLTSRVLVGGVAALALLIWLAVASLPDGRLHVTFLDVGQGDASLITLPDGRQILIDGGPSTTPLNWRLGQAMPFWDRNLDMVINTHPDADHLGGLVSLPDRFKIGAVMVNGVERETPLFEQWQVELARAGITPVVATTGTQLVLSPGIRATILHPTPAAIPQNKSNNNSVVLYLQYGEVSFLFPGDIEATVEQQLVNAGLPRATVLKSPHHGSNSSSSEPLLNATSPRVAVVSVDDENRFGLPSAEVLTRYAQHGLTVLRTDQQGTVDLITDGHQLWVKAVR